MKRVVAILVLALATGGACAQKVIRIAPQSNLTVLDPHFTTATVTRSHGYMVYDTLFGTDASSRVQPQMVDKWTVSTDRKTWTFTLRTGLEFHDGQPVTSEDVIASLERWAKKDSLGQRLAAAAERWEAVDARTFRLVLKEPFGMVLEALGKPGANVRYGREQDEVRRSKGDESGGHEVFRCAPRQSGQSKRHGRPRQEYDRSASDGPGEEWQRRDTGASAEFGEIRRKPEETARREQARERQPVIAGDGTVRPIRRGHGVPLFKKRPRSCGAA